LPVTRIKILASNKMAEGAHKVGVAGSSLVKAVDDFSTQFTQVLGDVRTDLSTAINNMSEQAAQTLEQGTKELGKATLEISTALGVLSEDVTTTMNGVKASIEKSLKIQQDGAVLFRRSSDTLNENVSASTELVQKLGEDIRSGLQAVSDSGRRMASIGKSLETIVPQMEDLLPALEPLKTLHIQHKPLLDETKALRADLLKIDSRQELQSIRQVIEKSLVTQQGESNLFKVAVDTLNDNVTATGELVNKFADGIRSGLDAVSTYGQRMTGIGESLETIVPNIQNISPALKPLEALPEQLRTLVYEIQEIRKDLKNQSTYESIPAAAS
jgi:methyl-accepting chemotaxis protein